MMNTGLTINAAATTIEMTKEFARKARYFGTDEYKLLQDARKDYPTFSVATRKTVSKESYKGLTTGSGKTYFALHEISSLCQNALHQAVYLIDTINGKEQILRNYNATECNKYWLRDIEGDYLWFQEDSRVVIMTYAKFGFILSTKPEFYNYFDYIICDELHSLIRFQYFSQLPNYHSIAKEGLERAVTNSKTTVIALTATPEIVKKEFNTAIYELPVSEDVRHYETTEVVRYTNLNALVSSINARSSVLV